MRQCRCIIAHLFRTPATSQSESSPIRQTTHRPRRPRGRRIETAPHRSHDPLASSAALYTSCCEDIDDRRPPSRPCAAADLSVADRRAGNRLRLEHATRRTLDRPLRDPQPGRQLPTDDPAAVEHNRRVFARALQAFDSHRAARMHQVHGSRVVTVDSTRSGG